MVPGWEVWKVCLKVILKGSSNGGQIPEPDSLSAKVAGIPDDEKYYVDITGLNPATEYYAEYGRVCRVGDSDTLLLVHHGGAPYIIQLPAGETVVSAHVYRGGDWHQSNMEVMIVDNEGRNFGSRTTPWGDLPLNQGAISNSMFLKDSETVVLISSKNVAGVSSSIYWLEGKIVTK